MSTEQAAQSQTNDVSAELQSQIQRILESCPIAGDGVNTGFSLLP
jgi:hypothetical protein